MRSAFFFVRPSIPAYCLSLTATAAIRGHCSGGREWERATEGRRCPAADRVPSTGKSGAATTGDGDAQLRQNLTSERIIVRPAPVGQYFRHFLSSIASLSAECQRPHPEPGGGLFRFISAGSAFRHRSCWDLFWTRQQRWKPPGIAPVEDPWDPRPRFRPCESRPPPRRSSCRRT